MPEFRQDIVSGDWVIIAPERRKRPHVSKHAKNLIPPKSECPFEHPERTENWPPLIRAPQKGQWKAILIPNKFPILQHDPHCPIPFRKGPYPILQGVGHHHLVVTRDHKKRFAHLSRQEAMNVLLLFQKYYEFIRKDDCLEYVSAFGNWGKSAGASIYHPHYQLLALPIVPPDVEHSLKGSRRYFTSHQACVHCAMIAHERKQKVRVIAENKYAIAFAPFVPRSSHEVRIFPKTHQPYFERTARPALRGVTEILQKIFGRIEVCLGDPDNHFFIHTPPLKNQNAYRHYHWHIEVNSRINIPGGFEASTGVDVIEVAPEETAALLRGKKPCL